MAIGRAILSLILFITLVRASPIQSGNIKLVDSKADINYLLPGEVVPTSYNLKLIPHFGEDDFTFDGEVDIYLKVIKDTKIVTMHSKELNITEDAILYNIDYNTTRKGKVSHDQSVDFLKIDFGYSLWTNTSFKLSLKFRGVLNDDLKGFYRSHYTNSEGKKVWLAATHFEPVGARQAFPCFDEPALKAKFSIQIQHRENYHAISNMHTIKTELVNEEKKQVLTTFAETPIMSSYLVAFVVSDFDKLENEDLNFRVWARKNKIQHGKYALEIGQQALKELEEYTGITMKQIGFKKMDNIAIPHFAAGAMENYALVLYKENALLVEEGVTSTSDNEDVATVIAHEFAHQFFGNLVSPKWWTWVWLNEGFANYFQNVITDKTESSWRQLDLAMIKNLQQTAFKADSESDAKPMNHPVQSPKEISAKFDSISYSKAGSVIRMITHILGEGKFKAGLKSYLKEMKEKSADSNDLFKELVKEFTENSFKKADFKKALENWAETPGFPVITVERDYVKNTSVITQERFLLKEDKHNLDKYYVPINLAQKPEDFNYTKVTHWMKPENANITIEGVKNNTWAIFNKQQFGYYRVNYDERNWKLIISTLNTTNFTNIHVLNRAQLVDDALNLARISKLDYSIALELVSYLKHEIDFVPWYPAWKGFEFLHRMLENTNLREDFKAYILNLLEPLEKSLKYSPDPEDEHLTKYQRVHMQDWACKLGSKSCKDDASAKFNTWLSDPKTLPTDHKKVVLCSGLRDSDQNKWNQIFDKYLQQNDSDLVTALGCSSNKEILKNYLHRVANKSLPFKNRENVFTAVYLSSKEGVDVALTVLTEEYQVVENITSDTATLKKYFTDIASYLNKQEHVDKLETFAKHVQDNIRDFPEEVAKGIDESISKAKSNVKWTKKAQRDISQFFVKKENDHKEPSSGVSFTVSTILLVGSFIVSQFYL